MKTKIIFIFGITGMMITAQNVKVYANFTRAQLNIREARMALTLNADDRDKKLGGHRVKALRLLFEASKELALAIDTSEK